MDEWIIAIIIFAAINSILCCLVAITGSPLPCIMAPKSGRRVGGIGGGGIDGGGDSGGCDGGGCDGGDGGGGDWNSIINNAISILLST